MGTSVDYKLIIRQPTGAKIAELVDYKSLAYSKVINEPGLLEFSLLSTSPAVSQITHLSQVEVWRRDRDAGVDWYADYYGLIMDEQRTYYDTNMRVYRAPGQMIMLDWRHVMYASDAANRAAFTTQPAETIMKLLVTYNCTSAGTVGEGRIRDATITYPGTISVEPDGASGTAIDWACGYRNVLDELQKLAIYGSVDFDLIKTGDATWDFRCYYPQRGTDRTATVVFAIEYGNMLNPIYRKNRITEKTVAVVGGQGVGAARTTRTVTGDDYEVGLNNIETFVDGRHLTTNAALDSLGARKLNELMARDYFDYDVIQVSGCRYGRNYCVGGVLGDLVTARWEDIVVTQQIVGSNVSANASGAEDIDIIVRTR